MVDRCDFVNTVFIYYDRGARHGHRMTAKQARSEAMERRLLRKMKKTEKARRKKVDTNEEPKKKPK